MDFPTLTLLKKGGYKLLRFGLESGSQSILQAMDKGISLAEAKQILENCKLVGIKTAVYIIIGFPGETPQSICKTKKFILDNVDAINYIGIHKFQLMGNSYLYNNYRLYPEISQDNSGHLYYKNNYFDDSKLEAIIKDLYYSIKSKVCFDIPASFITETSYNNVQEMDDYQILEDEDFLYEYVLPIDFLELGLVKDSIIYLHILTNSILISE